MFRKDTLNESISLVGHELAELTEEEFDNLHNAVSERLERLSNLADMMEGYKRNNRRMNFMKNSMKKKKPLVDKPHTFLSVSGKRLRGRG